MLVSRVAEGTGQVERQRRRLPDQGLQPAVDDLGTPSAAAACPCRCGMHSPLRMSNAQWCFGQVSVVPSSARCGMSVLWCGQRLAVVDAKVVGVAR